MPWGFWERIVMSFCLRGVCGCLLPAAAELSGRDKNRMWHCRHFALLPCRSQRRTYNPTLFQVTCVSLHCGILFFITSKHLSCQNKNRRKKWTLNALLLRPWWAGGYFVVKLSDNCLLPNDTIAMLTERNIRQHCQTKCLS